MGQAYALVQSWLVEEIFVEQPISLKTYAGLTLMIIHEGHPVGSIRIPAGDYSVHIISNPAQWAYGKGEIPWVVFDNAYIDRFLKAQVELELERARRERLTLIIAKPHCKLKPFPNGISSENVLVGIPKNHLTGTNLYIL